jgi:signal transduction histidine kinase
MTFSDDGVGFNPAGNSKRRGLGLVRRLMQQVDGSAEVDSHHGTTWTLKFPAPPMPAAPNGVLLVAPRAESSPPGRSGETRL